MAKLCAEATANAKHPGGSRGASSQKPISGLFFERVGIRQILGRFLVQECDHFLAGRGHGNGAFASGLGDDVGPLEPGKRADLLILSSPSYTRLPYELADDPIKAVVKDGWLVVDQGARVA